MKKILFLAKFRIKMMLKNKYAVILSVILPMLIMSILGMVFQSKDIGKAISIGVVDEDRSVLSQKFISNLQNQEILRCNVLTKSAAMDKLKSNDIAGVYIMKKGFGENIQKERIEKQVKVYYLEDNFFVPALGDIVAGELIPLICEIKANNKIKQIFEQNKLKKEVTKKPQSFKFQIDMKYDMPKSQASNNIDVDNMHWKKQIAQAVTLVVTSGFLLFGAVAIKGEQDIGIMRRMYTCGYNAHTRFAGNMLGMTIAGYSVLVMQQLLVGALWDNIMLSIGFVVIISCMILSIMSIVKDTLTMQLINPYILILISIVIMSFLKL